MSKKKFSDQTGTVECISDAFSDLCELASECREIVDNAPEGLSESERIQTFSATADTLESLDEPSVPECVSDLEIKWSEEEPRDRRSGLSRRARRDNAVSLLGGARDACQGWLDENQTHGDFSEVEQFLQDIENACDEAEGCEFPGMFG